MSTIAPPNSSILSSERLAQFCKASADELRVRILRILRSESFSVQELCHIFDLKQSAMSHHLKVLSAAQLVTTRREGNTIYYRRRWFTHNYPLCALQSSLFHSIDQCALEDSIATGIAHIEENRTLSSKTFFLENADKFRQQQDLIASVEQYVDSVDSVIKSIALPDKNHAIEVGPGEGQFLPFLAKQFTRVSAFDISSAMLHKSQQYVEKKKIGNIKFVLGDTRTAINTFSKAADCVVINMVLHHIATPADIFKDVSQLLKPAGALIVTDLCHHDQEWAKEACGDVWLGFEPDDLTMWASNAGLLQGQSSYLAQRNGFRIQIRHFYKPEETINE